MKTFLVLQRSRPLSRSEAWGCFTANLALPGSGSLVAGRAIGYAQLAASAVAMCMTVSTCLPFMSWYFQNYKRLQPNYYDEAIQNLHEIWMHLRWPMLSMGVFVFSLLWAGITSWQIIAAAKKSTPLPPVILS